jgi:hypothetical protein
LHDVAELEDALKQHSLVLLLLHEDVLALDGLLTLYRYGGADLVLALDLEGVAGLLLVIEAAMLLVLLVFLAVLDCVAHLWVVNDVPDTGDLLVVKERCICVANELGQRADAVLVGFGLLPEGMVEVEANIMVDGGRL